MRAAANLVLLSKWAKNVHLVVIPMHSTPTVATPEPNITPMLRSCQIVSNDSEPNSADSSHWSRRLRGTVPSELQKWNHVWQKCVDSAISEVRADLIFVFRFYLAPFVLPNLDSSARIWLDIDELESNSRKRLADCYEKANPDRAAKARMESAAYTKLEGELLTRFDRIFAASELESKMIRERGPQSEILVVPNTYSRSVPQPFREFDGTHRLLFVGTFGYYPNVDAIQYFARDILPIIKSKFPSSVEISVIGTGLPPHGETVQFPGINFVGEVPETTPYYSSCDIAIVPLRCGSGTRVKILEAFSHRRAVVATTIGAEGLDVADNCEIRVGDTPEQFADCCIDLLTDMQERNEIAQRGHDYFLRHHSIDSAISLIPQIFGNWQASQ